MDSLWVYNSENCFWSPQTYLHHWLFVEHPTQKLEKKEWAKKHTPIQGSNPSQSNPIHPLTAPRYDICLRQQYYQQVEIDASCQCGLSTVGKRIVNGAEAKVKRIVTNNTSFKICFFPPRLILTLGLWQ